VAQEREAVDVELSGLGFAAGAAEGVDGVADGDVDEA
jgi:hypothetical protein